MEENQGQMIYQYHARISWQKRRGNGYVNHFKDVEFVSRAESKEQMNKDVVFLMQIMSYHGLTGSKIVNFKVTEVYNQKALSRSFFYKENE